MAFHLVGYQERIRFIPWLSEVCVNWENDTGTNKQPSVKLWRRVILCHWELQCGPLPHPSWSHMHSG